MTPLISIICPVYNKEKCLQDTINSVFEQTSSNWELILVDDGSNDESINILKRYENNPKICCFYNSNVGPFRERLFGATKADGDYLLFLDADDILDKNTVDILSKQCVGYDFVKYNISFLGSNGISKEQHFEINTVEDYKRYIFEEKVNNICSTLIKKSVFDSCIETIKNIPSTFSAEDLLMQLPIISKISNILYIDKPLYIYRFVENSLARRKIDLSNIRKYINPFRVEYLKNYAEKWNMRENIYKVYYQAFVSLCRVFRESSKNNSVFNIIRSIRKINWIVEYCGGEDSADFIEIVGLNKNQIKVCKVLYGQSIFKCFFLIVHYKLLDAKNTALKFFSKRPFLRGQRKENE